MPAVALVLGSSVGGLSGVDLLGLAAMAALPTAQNVLLFAMHHRMPQLLVRHVVFASSVLSFPVTLCIAWLLS